MNNYGAIARTSSIFNTKYTFTWFLVALLVLVIIYPSTIVNNLNPTPTAVSIGVSDTTLGPYDTESSTCRGTPSIRVPKMASTAEKLPPQPILHKRSSGELRDCTAKTGAIGMHCEAKNCVAFFSMFEFYFPSCEDSIENWDNYLYNIWAEDIGSAWSVDNELDRRALVERIISDPNLKHRGINELDQCSVAIGFAFAQCEASNCFVIFEMFEFWYPGCERWVEDELDCPEHDLCHDESGSDDNDDDCYKFMDRRHQSRPLLRRGPSREIIANYLERNVDKDNLIDPLAESEPVNLLDDRAQYGRESSPEGPHDLPYDKTISHRVDASILATMLSSRTAQTSSTVISTSDEVIDPTANKYQYKRNTDGGPIEVDPMMVSNSYPPTFTKLPRPSQTPLNDKMAGRETEKPVAQSSPGFGGGVPTPPKDYNGNTDCFVQQEGAKVEPHRHLPSLPKPNRRRSHLPPQDEKSEVREIKFAIDDKGSTERNSNPQHCALQHDSEDNAHRSFSRAVFGDREQQAPSCVSHSSPLQIYSVEEDCGNQNDTLTFESCKEGVKVKNNRILCILIALGVFGLGFLSLVILNKIRQAKARRAPSWNTRYSNKGQSSNHNEQMLEEAPNALDGVNDGWTNWFLQKRDGVQNRRQFSPAPLAHAPRIPSLTLPKPTLATVRKLSGLGPDLENCGRKK